VTPERLRQIQELYHSAREREPDQRGSPQTRLALVFWTSR
jgi:hypothetical protein